MRTLFLLTVLTTLLVFVIKKPDQTFWEAAHGLWEKIEGLASEVAEAPPVPPADRDRRGRLRGPTEARPPGTGNR